MIDGKTPDYPYLPYCSLLLPPMMGPGHHVCSTDSTIGMTDEFTCTTLTYSLYPVHLNYRVVNVSYHIIGTQESTTESISNRGNHPIILPSFQPPWYSTIQLTYACQMTRRANIRSALLQCASIRICIRICICICICTSTCEPSYSICSFNPRPSSSKHDLHRCRDSTQCGNS